MADFVAVLKKTLDRLGETTPEMRARVYDKARSTIASKLAAINPPPSAAMAERQRRALEDAIAAVEHDYAKGDATSDPLKELEDIFSSIDRNRNQPSHARPAAKAEAAEPAQTDGRQPEAPPRAESGPVDAPAPEATPDPEPLPARNEEISTPQEPQEPAPADPILSHPPVSGQDTVRPDNDEPASALPRGAQARESRRGRGRLIAAVLAVLVVAGAGYAMWSGPADVGDDPSGVAADDTQAGAPDQPAAPDEQAPQAAAQDEQETTPAAESDQPTKFTQRLLPDGKEVDAGPAGGERSIGEGTSVVALTTQPPPTGSEPGAAPPPDQDLPLAAGTAAPGQAPQDAPTERQTLPVGQKAIFYEERTNVSEGSAEPGNVVWSLVQESPGDTAAPEPAIRAEATIPGKDVQLRMTIRRNADETLPASHIIEMIFLTPDGFEGGSVDNVLRVAMKASEQEAGSPLIGIPAKIADGFFLVALNDTKADESANLALLRKQDWIDIPVVYKSGRRALLTIEKGIPGEKVFDEALKAWQEKTAG